VAKIQLEGVTKVFPTGLRIGKTLNRMPFPDKIVRESSDSVAETEGNVLALDGLDLTVEDGETVVVVGPSGCGKSTLLRVVAGLADYDGTVLYDEKDVSDVPVKERFIGMVFQSYALYPHFYGQGNLNFFFKMNKAPDAEAEERIRATSEMMGFGFQDLLRRKPGTLSGGQQQRLAIARALVRQPVLFLFDEPLSNLDAKLRASTRVEIKRLLHTFAITAIYVTHDQVEAMALGDRVAVMRAGRIEQVGTFRDVMADPVNAFVAGFLGTPPMNLLDGTISDGRLQLGAGVYDLPDAIADVVHAGQAITVGIRPEAARIWGDGETTEGLTFTGTIDVVEPDFGRRLQTAYVSAEGFACSVTAPQDIRLTPGYPVDVHFPTEALYFFDGDSEQRLR